jgi:Family of unknown function (DUF6732)
MAARVFRTSSLFPAALALVLLPGAAQAHVGHLGDVAGHSHWIGVAALAGAAALAGVAALKGRRKREEDAETPEANAEPATEG